VIKLSFTDIVKQAYSVALEYSDITSIKDFLDGFTKNRNLVFARTATKSDDPDVLNLKTTIDPYIQRVKDSYSDSISSRAHLGYVANILNENIKKMRRELKICPRDTGLATAAAYLETKRQELLTLSLSLKPKII
jgi:hypothetical protein